MDAAWHTEAWVRELVRLLGREVQSYLGVEHLEPGFVFELYEQVRDALSRQRDVPTARAVEALRSSLALAAYMVTVSHPFGSQATPALLAHLDGILGDWVSGEAKAVRGREGSGET